MSYATFKQKVLELVQRSESGVKVIFHRNNGNHIADFSDGTRIMGNTYSRKVTVRWNGMNHQGVAVI